MSSGRIKDSQISSLDFYGSTRPQMARLFNVPLGTSTGPAHWSPKSSNSYLEVNLGKLYKITGVATQGHFDSNTREWAASYALTYRTSSGSWVSYNRVSSILNNVRPVFSNLKDMPRIFSWGGILVDFWPSNMFWKWCVLPHTHFEYETSTVIPIGSFNPFDCKSTSEQD